MLDIRKYREQEDLVRQGLAAKQSKVDVDAIVSRDRERRQLLTEVEGLKSRRNTV
ncbi:MAG: serine--tRNA ligase, partial [Kiritimatiellae bacterium]|nr:serine--tRNA ligase [Kiritimatiellia bacterium]